MKLTKVKGAKIQLEKRQNVPYKVEDDCPKCGLVHLVDLSNSGGKYGHHLTYPEVDAPAKLYFVCDNEECAHEWQVYVIVRLSVEVP